MNAPTPTLKALLEGETALMARFIALLEREQTALKVGDTEVLEGLGAEKVALVGELNQVGEARNRLLSAAGLGQDRVGVEAWMARNPKDFAVQQLWSRLKSSVVEAKELNLLNGKLIALRLQHNQQALGALLSSSTSPQNNLYGPDGQPTQLTGRRIIDAA